MFVEPPGLPDQSFDPVAVDGLTELLLGYREACADRGRFALATFADEVDEPEGENRIRFPGTEKRINMLLSLKPLVCFESMTNGA
jgi:hypothetical protein